MKLAKNYEAWLIDEKQYPESGTFQEQAIFLLRYALLAASTFNSQLWKCKIAENNIAIYIDRSRVPTASDKKGRFAHVSIGCFLENLRIASEHFGWKIDIEILSSNSNENIQLIAISSFIKGTPIDSPLFPAIPERTTNRSIHLNRTIPKEVIEEIQSFADKDNTIVFFDKSFAEKFIAISVPADFRIWGDKEFQREHVDWVRNNVTRKYDGMPGFGVGVKLFPSFFARPVILSPVFKKIQAKKNVLALRNTEQFVVLCSQDSDIAWTKIGMLFQRIALLLTSYGIAAAPMGQFIEDDTARAELSSLLAPHTKLKPQLFMRLGYPSQDVRHSPRLPVEKILL